MHLLDAAYTLTTASLQASHSAHDPPPAACQALGSTEYSEYVAYIKESIEHSTVSHQSASRPVSQPVSQSASPIGLGPGFRLRLGARMMGECRFQLSR